MRSIFFRRMVALMFFTMLVASLLMTGGYVYLSRDTYTALKLDELVPRAEAAGQLYVEYYNGKMELSSLKRVIAAMMQSSANMRCLITDSAGRPICQTGDIFAFSGEYQLTVQREVSIALAGERIVRKSFKMDDGEYALSVCVPIKDEAGTIYGSVFLLKPLTEMRRITGKTSGSLYLVLVLVLLLMFILSSFGGRHIVEPLRKMSEVAIEMRNGNFDVRADGTERGEFGLLARALNDLCDSLSQTIHQLRAEKSQLKQILASFTEGVVATDSLGCLTHYNTALKRMFGAVRVDTSMDLVPDEGIWRAFADVYRTGETQTMRYPLPGDRMIWITISPVITEEGERTGVVGLFKDMSEVERLERLRGEYIANISHELRTPLTAVRGLLEPLADGLVKKDADRRRYYDIMLREVLRLSRLITDMLQLSRLQSGTEYTELREVDVMEILEDVTKSYAKEAAERGINLTLEADTLPHVLSDPDRVEQVLIILLDNAIKYTGEGGSVTIRAKAGERVIVSVADTGQGIREEDLPHIFDRFYTVDKSRKEGGTGLGLSIAQQVMNKLGGKISVESEYGVGSIFSFTLKIYMVNAIALGPAAEDDDDAAGLPPIMKPQPGNPASPLDAPYEVLQSREERTEKSERKKGKGL
ncbi:MAG: cell wall metabolism sensor histidine kinase WalK [Clostridiales bacterium]|jgi:signal transduction histidine kinase|nr:cell wall metabolism sensor histidine kinase WalK [Clostridiales bacterium]